MDSMAIKYQLLKFRSARNNLLLVVAFTTINLFLTTFETGYYFLFSAAVPQALFGIGSGLAEDYQNNAFLVTGAILAFVGVGLYLMCWTLAKRWRWFILVALILFSIDTVLCILLIFIGEFDIFFLLDIACHIWVLYYLIIGVLAWSKLSGANQSDVDAAMIDMSRRS